MIPNYQLKTRKARTPIFIFSALTSIAVFSLSMPHSSFYEMNIESTDPKWALVQDHKCFVKHLREPQLKGLALHAARGAGLGHELLAAHSWSQHCMQHRGPRFELYEAPQMDPLCCLQCQIQPHTPHAHWSQRQRGGRGGVQGTCPCPEIGCCRSRYWLLRAVAACTCPPPLPFFPLSSTYLHSH